MLDDESREPSSPLDPKYFLPSFLKHTIDNFMKYFGEAITEIRDLRSELGEQEWTNRELKVSVKEKSMQIKLLLTKLEKLQKGIL